MRNTKGAVMIRIIIERHVKRGESILPLLRQLRAVALDPLSPRVIYSLSEKSERVTREVATWLRP